VTISAQPAQAPRASQARSRKTRESILGAAVQVLAESGVEGFTTIAVSTGAGVSVGSIYRRFGGKEQLLRATQAQYTSNFLEELTRKRDSFDQTQDADPGERVRHAVRTLVSTFHDNGAAMRVLLLLGLKDSPIYDEGAAASADGGRRYAEFLDRLGDAIAHDDRLHRLVAHRPCPGRGRGRANGNEI
jgi:AcrR family transcriptional regulator